MKLSTLIKSKKFDWVNSDITDDLFPAPKKIRTDFKLYHFDRNISSEDAIKEIEKDGYSPATAHELLSWKEWNDKDWVVALGSVARVGGDRCVLCLGGNVSRRDLCLGWFGNDWHADCRFLAVRNSDLKPSDTQKNTSEPLTLRPSDTFPDSIMVGKMKYVKEK